MSHEGKENPLAGQPTQGASAQKPEMNGVSGHLTFLKQVIWISVGSASTALVLYLVLYLQTGIWQLLAEAALLAVALGFAATALAVLRKSRTGAAGYLMLIGFVVAYGGAELVVASATLYRIIGSVFLIILIGNIFLPGSWRAWFVSSVLLGMFFWAVNTFEPVPRYEIARLPALRLLVIGVSLAAVVGVIVQLLRMLKVGTIRTRLTLSFELVVLLPAIVIMTVSVVYGQYSGRQQIIRQLESVAALKEVAIQEWVQNLQLGLEVELEREYGLERMGVVLRAEDMQEMQPADFEKLVERQWLFNRFKQAVATGGIFQELFLLNREGRVVLSSNNLQEGEIYQSQAFFREGLKGFYLQPPLYLPAQERAQLVAALPVADEQGQLIGVLAGRASLDTLNTIMRERRGLGETGETYLVGTDHILLTESRFPEYRPGETYIHTAGVDAALDSRRSGSGTYNNYRGVPAIGAFYWLPELQLVLLAEQDQAEAFRPIYTTLGINVAVALSAVLFAGVAALFITRGITNPLVNLAEIARQIADGDLKLAAPVERADEVGTLAEAFNSMTGQLRGLIDSLEDQVANRTRRLETLALLSERLNAILNLEELLLELVTQIQQTFGYYHAHIYLFDEQQKSLVVAAGTGEAGSEMKAQGHSIPLNAPTSLVARAARTMQTVRIDNVREAKGWLPNPLLPDTHSEMAVPIILDSQVVGVLDVQEKEVAGLDEGDAGLLRSLANQVAVSIRNARLFTEVEMALAEARLMQERYQQQAWEKIKQTQVSGRYHYHRPGAPLLDGPSVAALHQKATEDTSGIVIEGETEHSALLAPIKLQDQVIGHIQLHDLESRSQWTDQELALIQAVADQAAHVAENLRLFNETRERASREQLISHISDKMRRAPDLETLMQTAVGELSRVLSPARTFIRFSSEGELTSSNTAPENDLEEKRQHGQALE